jgi:hypothetical protein
VSPYRRGHPHLHDVVTHHVTTMVVQAKAARYLATALSDDRSASSANLDGRHSSTSATYSTCSTRPRHPVASGLRTLVEHTRRAGQPVEFIENGTAETTGSAGQVANRSCRRR